MGVNKTELVELKKDRVRLEKYFGQGKYIVDRGYEYWRLCRLSITEPVGWYETFREAIDAIPEEK